MSWDCACGESFDSCEEWMQHREEHGEGFKHRAQPNLKASNRAEWKKCVRGHKLKTRRTFCPVYHPETNESCGQELRRTGV